MTEKEILDLRDLVSVTVQDLILTTANIEKELITIYLPGKEIELPIAELDSRKNSAKNFIAYLKEKLQ